MIMHKIFGMFAREKQKKYTVVMAGVHEGFVLLYREEIEEHTPLEHVTIEIVPHLQDEELFPYLQSHYVDLIIVGEHLHGMNWFDLSRKCKESYPSMPVMVLSERAIYDPSPEYADVYIEATAQPAEFLDTLTHLLLTGLVAEIEEEEQEEVKECAHSKSASRAYTIKRRNKADNTGNYTVLMVGAAKGYASWYSEKVKLNPVFSHVTVKLIDHQLGKDIYPYLRDNCVDLLVVGDDLEGEYWYDLCTEYKKHFFSIPVMVLLSFDDYYISGSGFEYDKQGNADAYVTASPNLTEFMDSLRHLLFSCQVPEDNKETKTPPMRLLSEAKNESPGESVKNRNYNVLMAGVDGENVRMYNQLLKDFVSIRPVRLKLFDHPQSKEIISYLQSNQVDLIIVGNTIQGGQFECTHECEEKFPDIPLIVLSKQDVLDAEKYYEALSQLPVPSRSELMDFLSVIDNDEPVNLDSFDSDYLSKVFDILAPVISSNQELVEEKKKIAKQPEPLLYILASEKYILNMTPENETEKHTLIPMEPDSEKMLNVVVSGEYGKYEATLPVATLSQVLYRFFDSDFDQKLNIDLCQLIRVTIPPVAFHYDDEIGHHDSASSFSFYNGLMTSAIQLEESYRLSSQTDMDKLLKVGFFAGPKFLGSCNNKKYGKWLIQHDEYDLYQTYSEYFSHDENCIIAGRNKRTIEFVKTWIEKNELSLEGYVNLAKAIYCSLTREDLDTLKISPNEEYEVLLEQVGWVHGVAGILKDVIPPGRCRNNCVSIFEQDS